MLAHFYTLSAEEERGTLEAQDGRPALLHERLSQNKQTKVKVIHSHSHVIYSEGETDREEIHFQVKTKILIRTEADELTQGSKRPKLACRSCLILSISILKRALNFYVTELCSGLDHTHKKLLKDPAVYLVHIPAEHPTHPLLCSNSTWPLQVRRHNS